MNDLQAHDPQLHQRVLQTPSECLPPFQEALDELIRCDRWAARYPVVYLADVQIPSELNLSQLLMQH